jgi:carboxypeptidase PM20D1
MPRAVNEKEDGVQRNHNWAISSIFQEMEMDIFSSFVLPNLCHHSYGHNCKNDNKLQCQPCTQHSERGVFKEMYKTLLFVSVCLLGSGSLVDAATSDAATTTTDTTTSGINISFILSQLGRLFRGVGVAILLLLVILFVIALFKKSSGLSLAEKKKLSKKYYQSPDSIRISKKSKIMATHLSEAIQYQTVSYDANDNKNTIDYNEFIRLHQWFQKTYPNVHKHFERHVINDYSLLYIWRGTNDDDPYMVYGHMDVVPILGQKWSIDNPFSGEIKPDDTGIEHIWGRGAIDLKNICVGWMECFEDLLESGYRPKRTIYFGLGHDEEIGGNNGAKHISNFVKNDLKGKKLEFLWDEGLFVIDGVIKGHQAPVAMICTSEKGFVNIQLDVQCSPTHSSFPPVLSKTDGSPIDILSNACARLASNPMKSHSDGPMTNMFRELGPGFNWPLKIVMCNLWLLSSIVKKILSSKAKTSALVRTSTALTIFNAGFKANTIPENARAIVNHRKKKNHNGQCCLLFLLLLLFFFFEYNSNFFF